MVVSCHGPQQDSSRGAFPMLDSDIYQPELGNPNVTQKSLCPQSAAILTGFWHTRYTVNIKEQWVNFALAHH